MSGAGEAVALQALSEQELSAWRGLLAVHATVIAELEAQLRVEHDLQLSSYEVLMFLADAEEERLRMAEIAGRVLLTRSGLTRLIDRLVELGLVERSHCDEDARGSFARLTDRGREKAQAARRTHLEGIRRVFLDRLGAREQRALGDAWTRVLGAS